jgi:Cu/Ag efflux pump CusA
MSEAFPDVTNTAIDIIAQRPGQSVEKVEKLVTTFDIRIRFPLAFRFQP